MNLTCTYCLTTFTTTDEAPECPYCQREVDAKTHITFTHNNTNDTDGTDINTIEELIIAYKAYLKGVQL